MNIKIRRLTEHRFYSDIYFFPINRSDNVSMQTPCGDATLFKNYTQSKG
jgi:hypothetical protein